MKRPNIKTLFIPSKTRMRKQLPVSLRTNVGEILYKQSKDAGLLIPLHLEERLKEWKYWALIDNAYPYDAAFKKHHLLIPKRVVTEDQLTDSEKTELQQILKVLSTSYDCQLVNFTSKQSLKNHHHIHLMTYKDNRSDIKLH